MERISIVIDRNKWYRGKGSTYSKLLTLHGHQCCVGQMCTALGVPDKYLFDVGTLDRALMALPAEYKEKLKPLFDIGVKLHPAYEINDSYVRDSVREEKLTALMGNFGIDLTFQGDE